MSKKKNDWDSLPENKKQECINAIITFVKDNWDESIGIIAAEEFYDLIMDLTFSSIYNKGVKDAQKMIQEKMADLSVDLDLLIKK